MNEHVFEAERDFIKAIHQNIYVKKKEIRVLTGMKDIDFDKPNDIEKITNFFMKIAAKSDKNFIYWLFVIGIHIKSRYKGKWVLFHYEGIDMKIPAIINDEQEIWEVGNFCYKYYYKKRRMQGISYKTFYKLAIERMIWKPKFTDLNIPKENFFFIENKGM